MSRIISDVHDKMELMYFCWSTLLYKRDIACLYSDADWILRYYPDGNTSRSPDFSWFRVIRWLKRQVIHENTSNPIAIAFNFISPWSILLAMPTFSPWSLVHVVSFRYGWSGLSLLIPSGPMNDITSPSSRTARFHLLPPSCNSPSSLSHLPTVSSFRE